MASGDTTTFNVTSSQPSNDTFSGGANGDTVTYNFTDVKASQVGYIDPNSSSYLEYAQYTGLNGQGTKQYQVFDNNNGTSQGTFYNPSAGFSYASEVYSAEGTQGEVTSETAAATNSYIYDYTFVYSNGTLVNYYMTVDSSSGSEVDETEFNSNGQEVDQLYGSDSGVSNYAPDFDEEDGPEGVSATEKSTSTSRGTGLSVEGLTSSKTSSFGNRSETSSFTPLRLVGKGATSSPTHTANRVDAVAQSRIANLIQAMSTFHSHTSSLQSSSATQDMLTQSHLSIAVAGHNH